MQNWHADKTHTIILTYNRKYKYTWHTMQGFTKYWLISQSPPFHSFLLITHTYSLPKAINPPPPQTYRATIKIMGLTEKLAESSSAPTNTEKIQLWMHLKYA